MIVEALSVGLIQTNCYVVGCPETRQGAIIDPGGHASLILEAVEHHGLQIQYVLNTHAHFDHTQANADVVAATGAPLAIHPLDRPLLEQAGGAALFGIQAESGPPPDIELGDGDQIQLGTLTFQVLHTPGHTPGHVCFYEAKEGVLFDGDLLFYRGVGRADLPGGDWQQLIASIHNKILVLPDETVVYSGHGPATTVGAEKRQNPWLS